MIDYGIVIQLDSSMETVLDEVRAHLENEGFGVLTTIDVKQKLKEKLDVDFRKYMILGACNPSMAHQALRTEENIGLMLPCNVIVYEQGGKTVVAAIRPTVAMQMIDNPELRAIAEQVEQSLRKVIESLAPVRSMP